MGASGWDYVVPYQDDVARSFTELQRQVLADGDYYQGMDDMSYSSLEALAAAKQEEEFWEEGTHSILDMDRIIPAEQDDSVAAVRALSRDEIVALFGSATPTRSDFERVQDTDWSTHFPRWSGRYAVLYNDGTPHEVAFWGYSGD